MHAEQMGRMKYPMGIKLGLLLSKCVGYYPISDDYFKACIVFRFFINYFICDLYTRFICCCIFRFTLDWAK